MKGIDMMDLNEKIYIDFLIATVILFIISLSVTLCAHDWFLKTYLENILVGCMTCTFVTSLVAFCTHRFMRKQNIVYFTNALVAIRNCLIQITSYSDFSGMENVSYGLCKNRVRHYCNRILSEYELIEKNELYEDVYFSRVNISNDDVAKCRICNIFDQIFRRFSSAKCARKQEVGIRKPAILHSLANILLLVSDTKQRIDSEINGEQDENKDWVNDLKYKSFSCISESEDMIIKFVEKYCYKDVEKIQKRLAHYQLDAQTTEKLKKNRVLP